MNIYLLKFLLFIVLPIRFNFKVHLNVCGLFHSILVLIL
jgi:hypothetical protein